MNRQNVTKLCCEFSEGRTDVHDDDDEVQEEVMTWFKGQAAHFYDSGIQKVIPRPNNIWTMPATMLKNEVMYRQFIHSVAFVN